ncbi:hypothetical protein [Robinsoniella peoriensis]
MQYKNKKFGRAMIQDGREIARPDIERMWIIYENEYGKEETI